LKKLHSAAPNLSFLLGSSIDLEANTILRIFAPTAVTIGLTGAGTCAGPAAAASGGILTLDPGAAGSSAHALTDPVVSAADWDVAGLAVFHFYQAQV
jgi:hypothetical protein